MAEPEVIAEGIHVPSRTPSLSLSTVAEAAVPLKDRRANVPLTWPLASTGCASQRLASS